MSGAPVESPPQQRLQGEEGGCPQDEPGHDVDESGYGGREKEDGANDAAGQPYRGQAEQPRALISDLLAVPGRRGQIPGPDADRVGDVGGESGVAEPEQD